MDELIQAYISGAQGLSRADKLRCYKLLRERLIESARTDPAAFMEYAFPHEKTGRPVKNAEFHIEWHRFFSAVRWGVIQAAVEHGKTQQIGICRMIWEIGRNPTLRCLLIGANDAAARKSLAAIRRHIDGNPCVREIFPNLVRSPRRGDPWNDNDIRVAGASLSRDPTIQARSAGSKNVLGSRIDLAIIDDLLNHENTGSKVQRDKLAEWFDDVVVTRIADDYESGDFGRVFAIGNPWDVDDLLARVSKLPGWQAITTSAVENPDDPPERWRPRWPAQWPLERLLDRRSKMLPQAFARKYLCRVMDAGARRFLRVWIDHMLALGRGRTLLARRPTEHGRPMRCFTGVDIGIGKKDTDARTCFFTWAVDRYNRRIVADIRSGHWTGPEILKQAADVAERFDSEIGFEGNAAQRWAAEFGAERGILSRAINTGREKWDEEFGVESLAVLMRGGFLIAPSGPTGHEIDPEVSEWTRECYDYNPEQHAGDRLMASWIGDKMVREFLEPRFASDSNHIDR